ncbi:uncharacterized protein LOC135817647 [Sycon ciliatum]|uniref:uncharacterized protein LOC135817647 n=1 Tax=Sycon ciliatum TaxID=27933 RepID=UPI0031F62CC2
MDREDALVTSASEIGELRPHESTGSSPDVAVLAKNSASEDSSSDSEELLVPRSRKNHSKRKRATEPAAKTSPVVNEQQDPDHDKRQQGLAGQGSLPVNAGSSESIDRRDGEESESSAAAAVSISSHDSLPSSTVAAAAGSVSGNEGRADCSVSGTSLSSSRESLGVGSAPVAITATTHDAGVCSAGQDQSHAQHRQSTPTQKGSSTMCDPADQLTPTPDRVMSNSNATPTCSTPTDTPLKLDRPLVVHTPSNTASGASWLAQGLTTPCEVVDVSSHNISEDVDTADEAEVDITTQIASATDTSSPVDAALLRDLERRAHFVAGDLTHLMGNMSMNLHAMSAVSSRCMEAYRESIDDLGVNVDESIKSMYLLIAKCESISNDMKPIYSLADQIKSIKRTLAVFEQMCK